MSMTKKHFNAIAEIVKTAIENNPGAKGTISAMGYKLATLCENDNPNFDLGRFLTACGIEEVQS
jgi:hypothetical protein